MYALGLFLPSSSVTDLKKIQMQEKLYRHFLSEGHAGFLHNISVTLIDKTDGSNPTERENYWMRTLKTLEPYGLNVENSI